MMQIFLVLLGDVCARFSVKAHRDGTKSSNEYRPTNMDLHSSTVYVIASDSHK